MYMEVEVWWLDGEQIIMVGGRGSEDQEMLTADALDIRSFFPFCFSFA
jgi:hypothetical protein